MPLDDTQIDSSIAAASRFLTFLHGSETRAENNHIYLQSQRIAKKDDVEDTEDSAPSDDAFTDEHRGKGGKLKTDGAWFQSPDKLSRSSWLIRALPSNSLYFCTGVVTGQRNENGRVVNPATGKLARHGAVNVDYIPVVWTDIDACKELDIDAEEFVADLRDSVEMSALVRSSDKGVQLYWKLDTPFVMKGNKEVFDNQLAPLLYSINYHFGGDFRAALPSQLLRLPGSYNRKPEYPEPVLVTAQTWEKQYTLDELNAMFPCDPTLPPKIIIYQIAKALAPLWVSGQRHDVALALAGTMHQSYVDAASMKALMRAVCRTFRDEEDRTVNIDTTFGKDREGELKSLASFDMTAHLTIKRACEWWMRHKVAFTKKMKLDYTPERPTMPSDEEVTELGVGNIFFRERNGKTFVVDGEEGTEAEFANFIMRVDYTLVTVDGREVWLADFVAPFASSRKTQISAKDHSSKDMFIKSCCPTGAAILVPRYWDHYIAWKAMTKPANLVYETNHYGVMDYRSPNPTFVLPHEKHPKYEYTAPPGSPDPMKADFWEMEMSDEEVREYLQTFVDYYAVYHAPQYIWPTLGWFAACPMSPFIRRRHTGFPTLNVIGIAGCGKSELMHRVLAMHFGIKTEQGFEGTTPFALQQVLGVSNIIPCCLDEFRATSDQTGVGKVRALEGMIRSLYDGSAASKGRSDLSVREMRVLAPFAITGEQGYTDEAAIQRSFVVRMGRDELSKKKAEMKQFPERAAQLKWLYDQGHRGKFGHIVLNFVRQHQDKLDDIIAKAEEKVESYSATYPIDVDRKRKGFQAIMAGLMLFRTLCIHYGVDLKQHPKEEWYESLFAADSTFTFGNTYDQSAFWQAFDATDSAMIDMRSRRLSLASICVPQPGNSGLVWFELKRWHRLMQGARRPNATPLSAGLATADNLYALIDQSIKDDPNTVFAHLGSAMTPEIKEAYGGNLPYNGLVVAINLPMVSERYGVSTSTWVDMVEEE